MKVNEGWLGPLMITRSMGIGTIFLRNLIKGLKQKDKTQIHLRAGRENGPTYWSRRGFGFEEELFCTRSDFYKIVAANKQRLVDAGKLPANIVDQVDRILAAPYHRLVNCRIASLNHDIDGTPAGVLLMEGVNEFRAVLDLNDPETQPYIDHIYSRAAYYAEGLRREQMKHGLRPVTGILAAE